MTLSPKLRVSVRWFMSFLENATELFKKRGEHHQGSLASVVEGRPDQMAVAQNWSQAVGPCGR